jgi:hypothetical protein
MFKGKVEIKFYELKEEETTCIVNSAFNAEKFHENRVKNDLTGIFLENQNLYEIYRNIYFSAE